MKIRDFNFVLHNLGRNIYNICKVLSRFNLLITAVILKKKFKDALSRQANEAVRISTRPDRELLNSKSEFNHPPLSRVVVERRKKTKQHILT